MSLPKIIMVTEQKEQNGERYLIASRNVEEAIGDDELYTPRIVGVYKMFNKRTIVKTFKATKEVRVR